MVVELSPTKIKTTNLLSRFNKLLKRLLKDKSEYSPKKKKK